MNCVLCQRSGAHTTVRGKVICMKCIDLILSMFYDRLQQTERTSIPPEHNLRYGG